MTLTIAAANIAAQAFRFMECSPISSFDDDTEQAQSAAEQYPLALGHCLSAADWSFASVLVALPPATPALTLAADPDMPYFYALPGDCVKIREVGDRYTKWRVDRDGLRSSDAAPLRMRYTAAITNEAVTPSAFQTAVAAQLAVLLGPRWLGTQSKMEALKQDAAGYLQKAMAEDGRQASDARYDGLEGQDDWVLEAMR